MEKVMMVFKSRYSESDDMGMLSEKYYCNTCRRTIIHKANRGDCIQKIECLHCNAPETLESEIQSICQKCGYNLWEIPYIDNWHLMDESNMECPKCHETNLKED